MRGSPGQSRYFTWEHLQNILLLNHTNPRKITEQQVERMSEFLGKVGMKGELTYDQICSLIKNLRKLLAFDGFWMSGQTNTYMTFKTKYTPTSPEVKLLQILEKASWFKLVTVDSYQYKTKRMPCDMCYHGWCGHMKTWHYYQTYVTIGLTPFQWWDLIWNAWNNRLAAIIAKGSGQFNNEIRSKMLPLAVLKLVSLYLGA
jgi:hypothetical protein